MITKLITKVFGTKAERDLKRVRPAVEQINSHFESYRSLSDEELAGKTEEFRRRLEEGETVDDLLPEAFGAVKEASRRLLGRKWMVCGLETTWNMFPYDGQPTGAVFLH